MAITHHSCDQHFYVTHEISFLWHKCLGVWITGHYGKYLRKCEVCFKNLSTYFPEWYTILDSHQHCMRGLVSLSSLAFGIVTTFYFRCSTRCIVVSLHGFNLHFLWWLMILNIYLPFIASLVKCLMSSHFLIEFFCFTIEFWGFFILDKSPLLSKWFAKSVFVFHLTCQIYCHKAFMFSYYPSNIYRIYNAVTSFVPEIGCVFLCSPHQSG